MAYEARVEAGLVSWVRSNHARELDLGQDEATGTA